MGSIVGRRSSTASISGISTDYVEVLLGLSEGQVEGLVGGGQDIFLDDTPVENPDGSTNFEDLQYRFFNGSINQDVGGAVGEQSILTSVGVEVRNIASVTRTINNADINAIRVRLGLQLQKQSGNNIEKNSISYRILLREGGGAFVEKIRVDIKERYSSLTVFEYLIAVDQNQEVFTVRVEKLTTDAAPGDASTDIKTLTWLTYAEIVQSRIEYANTSVIRTYFPSTLFQSNPATTIKLAGVIWDIPTNATVDPSDRGLIFSGGWDGQFYKPALATSDPAWIVWGLCTNSLFGANISPQYLDKYALYQCSVYNNGLVDDGYGGQERRFTFNGILGNEQGAIETIRTVCSSFAAKHYWNGAQHSFWQERPERELPKILCNADVENGTFTYTSAEYLAVTTYADVFWQNPDEKYNLIPEPVAYPGAIAAYGVVREKFTALGETRRGGAIRAGRRIILNSLPTNNQQVSCKVRGRALFFRPGDVIQVADSGRGRQRKSGLVSAATPLEITLDAPTSITSAVDRRILVTMPDETTQERTITNLPGTHSVITLDVPLPAVPNAHATWQIVDGSIDLVKYRIISVEPDPNPNLYKIVGKLYKDSIYEEIETGWNLTPINFVDKPPSIMPPPRNLVVNLVNGVLDSYWNYPVRANGDREPYTSYYVAEYRIGIDGDWSDRKQTNQQFAAWQIGTQTEVVYVRVAAVSTNDKQSSWVTRSTED